MTIDLWPTYGVTIECSNCGANDINKWGLPYSAETAELVSNEFQGDWGCKPACQKCYEDHAAGLLKTSTT